MPGDTVSALAWWHAGRCYPARANQPKTTILITVPSNIQPFRGVIGVAVVVGVVVVTITVIVVIVNVIIRTIVIAIVNIATIMIIKGRRHRQ